MELKQVSAELLEREPVKHISHGLLYYVLTGRNAWHSKWITQYADGCMHTTLDSAKGFAESRRTSGTVFYIKHLPCLIFRSLKQNLMVTEINNKNPLSGYSPDATTGDVGRGREKIKGALDNYLCVGAPLYGVAMSFSPTSRFWNVTPALRDSIIILSNKDQDISIEAADFSSLKSYQSFSHGSGYRLGWLSQEPSTKGTAISQLYKDAIPAKTISKK